MATNPTGFLPLATGASSALDTKGLASLKAQAGQSPDKAVKAAAREFEALFLNQVMKSLRESLPKDGPFQSPASQTYTEMLDRELAKSMSAKGTGLAAMIERQLSGAMKAQGTGAKAAANGATYGIGMAPKAPATNAQPAAAAKTASARWANPVEQKSFLAKVASLAEGPAKAVGLAPAFVAAQAALESGWGKREIRHADGTSAHNLFSIKAGKNWTGPTVDVTTTEYVNGAPVKRVEKFRAYASHAEGLADYVKLLSTSTRYREAVANGQDAAGFTKAIAKSGYATDPQYGQKLARVIEQARRAGTSA